MNHCFNEELNAKKDDHSCLFADSPLNSKKDREKLTELMFETFDFQGFYI